MSVASFSPFHVGPLRRGVILLALAALAHLVLAFLALAAWQSGALPFRAPVAVLAPVVAATESRFLLAAVAVLGVALAALALAAAVSLKRLTRRAHALSKAAAYASLLNVPVGSLLGLLALGQLTAPRVTRFLKEQSEARRIFVRKV